MKSPAWMHVHRWNKNSMLILYFIHVCLMHSRKGSAIRGCFYKPITDRPLCHWTTQHVAIWGSPMAERTTNYCTQIIPSCSRVRSQILVEISPSFWHNILHQKTGKLLVWIRLNFGKQSIGWRLLSETLPNTEQTHCSKKYRGVYLFNTAVGINTTHKEDSF